jgi:peptidoglycan/LPS O-acetylase OafA/YrhL
MTGQATNGNTAKTGRSGDHLDYIDSLRGLAIILVITVHVGVYYPLTNQTLQIIINQGARGVQLFFVVSAFTLVTSWNQRKDGAASFYIRRFCRIAPMFWLAIAFFVLLNGLTPRHDAPAGLSGWHVALTALFMHGWLPETINSVVPGGWSIAVEMTFYIFFPVIVKYCKNVRTIVIALIISLLDYPAISAGLTVAIDR